MNKGRSFEQEVATILRDGGFQVTVNPGTARPRQTDLYARSDDLTLLVEAKNQKRRVGLPVVVDLRDRLARIAPDIIGVIVTSSAFTRDAVKAIESDRSREVLAITGEEVEDLRNGRANLRTLIELKRDTLRREGRVRFGHAGAFDAYDRPLPDGNVVFRIDDVTSFLYESRAAHMHATFVLNIPDPGWGTSSGDGAVLNLHLELHTTADLQGLLGYLHDRFGLSKNGMFSIQQSEIGWHGAGAGCFVQAVEHWHDRYSSSQAEYWHHSEDLTYFDQFRDGRLALYSRQRVFYGEPDSRGSFLHGSELSIQLRGVPVDMAPFLELCRRTGNDWAGFEHIGVRQTFTHRFKVPIKVAAIGTVVRKQPAFDTDEPGPRSVVGIIVENPFFDRALPKVLDDDERTSLQALTEVERLLCSLRDWHDEGDVIDHYVLQGVETAVTGYAHTIRPFGTWHEILKRRWPQEEKSRLAQKALGRLAAES